MPSRAQLRLEIRHTTGYLYESEVTASYNEVRVSPARVGSQLLLDHHIEVWPEARLFAFVDYWDTQVHAFDLRRPHRELTVVASSFVETAATLDAGDAELTWADVEHVDVQDRFCEFLMPTPYTGADEAIDELAVQVRHAASPADAVELAEILVRERLSYEPGATHVATTAAEALAAGAGVCQDFVHLVLAVLRTAGVPCRYASGYLLPRSSAEVGEAVEGESHAWLEAWIGQWRPSDPTNGHVVGPEHVLVARGRDYRDVAPLRGVYHGGRAEALDVQVEITRRG